MLIEENKRDCILDNFKLINQKEIIDFIRSNTGLLELIEKVYPLLESYFPDYFYSLSYATTLYPSAKKFILGFSDALFAGLYPVNVPPFTIIAATALC